MLRAREAPSTIVSSAAEITFLPAQKGRAAARLGSKCIARYLTFARIRIHQPYSEVLELVEVGKIVAVSNPFLGHPIPEGKPPHHHIIADR